jgi:hypothetical protein
MLVVYTDVKPRHERDLNEWYNREHIDERIGLPGFHRARRYVAVRGAPRYLATYECDSVSDLATPAYLARLSRQTPWSDRVTARFTRFHRLTLVIKVDLTHGVGGLLTTVRFTPAAGLRTALIQWLRRTLQAAVARPGMVGAAAGENDVDTANAPLREKSMDRPKAEDAEWVVLLEGSDDRAMATARRAFTLAALRKFGVGQAPTVATYRFLFGNQR